MLSDLAASDPGWRIARAISIRWRSRWWENWETRGIPVVFSHLWARWVVGESKLQIFGGDWPTPDGSGGATTSM